MPDSTNSLQDILYDKTYECPVCHKNFTSKAIRVGRNKVLSTDVDLYTKYDSINPILYDAVLCPHCGYCALSKNFSILLPTQANWLKDTLQSQYKKRTFGTYMSLQDAITKHQLALVCSIIKKGKTGEQAYICLHIAWLYRDLKDAKGEKLYLKKAVEGFKQAIATENFPIYSLDSPTTFYIIAAISYQLEEYDVAKSYLGDLIYSAQGQLKNRALDLKALVSNAKNNKKSDVK